MTDRTAAAPEAIRDLARRRATARQARDWALADDLRAQIEAAGWRVVDSGTSYRLAPASPPDVREPGRTLFGSAASVPSRLGQPPTGPASFVVHLDRGLPDGGLPVLEAVRAHAPRGCQVVIVADSSSLGRSELLEAVAQASGGQPEEVDDATADPGRSPCGEAGASAAPGDADLVGVAVELLWTGGPLGPAASLEAGARRARADTVVVLAPDVALDGDVLDPIRRALDDPGVAVVGSEGLVSDDLHHLAVGRPGPVTALGDGCLAFRRAELSERGPLDARLASRAGVAAWWSLALREPRAGVPLRRAVAIDLPVRRERATRQGPHEEAVGPHADRPAAGRDRGDRRDRYRIAARFAEHRDVLVMTPEDRARDETA